MYDSVLQVVWYVFRWIPWVLPFVVGIGLFILQRIFARTKNKIVEIQKNKENKKKPEYNLTTAKEYQAQYKTIAEQQLMEQIRTEASQG